jgi:hypothetical protein
VSNDLDGSKTATFDFGGKAVEVTYTPAIWVVRVGDRVVEHRRLDEALEEVLGKSARLAKLAVDVLDWAMLPL